MTATAPAVTQHPAKWSPPILATITDALASFDLGPSPVLLDPFAGRGLDDLRGAYPDADWIGVELEPEWAMQCPGVVVGDARALTHLAAGSVTGTVTSMSYGNRMADAYDGRDGSRRMTYRIALGRALTPGSTSAAQWGGEFRALHRAAFTEMFRVTGTGGPCLVNVSNHVRRGEVQHVMEWTCDALAAVGYRFVRLVPIRTRRYGDGANRDARVESEHLIAMVKP